MSASVYTRAFRHPRRSSRKARKAGWKVAVIGYCVLAVAGLFSVNWIYQVIRKPGEIFAPISDSFANTPRATWRNYGALFEQHSTSILSPELLAALAQVESSGNPIARTYWRWQWSWRPFEMYRPASSALGMFQITDGTFAEARKYCIRDHQVVAEGPWHDLRSCWFNSLYTRTLPSHASEMTAAYLHHSVVKSLRANGAAAKLRREQKQKLAAVIHLCGLRRGETFVRRGFRSMPGERCGSHDLALYLKQIDIMTKHFSRLRGTS